MSQPLSAWRMLRSILLVLALSLLAACGGGSTGTGGDGTTTRISGRLLSPAGLPIPGAQITIGESGDTGATDQNGAFELDSQRVDQSLTFMVETERSESSAVLNDIPPSPARINVVLQLDEDRSELEIDDVDFSDAPIATPTPKEDEAAPSPVALTFDALYPSDYLEGATLELVDGKLRVARFKKKQRFWEARLTLPPSSRPTVLRLVSRLGTYLVELHRIHPKTTAMTISSVFLPFPSGGTFPLEEMKLDVRSIRPEPQGIRPPQVTVTRID